MKNILVPTDFSQQANNALTVACEIARKSGSNIHLLHVLDVSLGGGFSFNTMGEPSGYTTMDQVYVLQLRDITSRRLAELAQQNSGDGFTIVPEVQVGNIFSMVTSHVEEHNIDLIVMGTKGSSGIEEFYVGSNTEMIVLRAACRVLSVKNVLPGFSIRTIAFASNFEKDQLVAVGNNVVFLTDRGNSFGYSDLVVDFRNIPEMQANQVPVVMDCTHSLQQPNQSSGVTGGKPALIETIAKAAIAVGADGLFIETHPRLSEAKSDAANMLPLDKLENLLEKLVKIRKAVIS